jgi:hypothetical protein
MRFARLLAGMLERGVLLIGLNDCVVGSASSDSLDVSLGEIAHAYHDYPQIDRAPYRSSLGAFDVNVYVSPDAAAGYTGIDPDRHGSRAAMPPGAVVVRQVLDPGGAVEKLTIMAKRAAGYNPMCGDWWFGVTDPVGNVLDDPSGVPQVGALTACASCHIPRAGDDYLFGVPAADRR